MRPWIATYYFTDKTDGSKGLARWLVIAESPGHATEAIRNQFPLDHLLVDSVDIMPTKRGESVFLLEEGEATFEDWEEGTKVVEEETKSQEEKTS